MDSDSCGHGGCRHACRAQIQLCCPKLVQVCNTSSCQLSTTRQQSIRALLNSTFITLFFGICALVRVSFKSSSRRVIVWAPQHVLIAKCKCICFNYQYYIQVALFSDDTRLAIAGPISSDIIFFSIAAIVMALFAVEWILLILAEPGYPFSLFFWLDLVSWLSLIPDIPVQKIATLAFLFYFVQDVTYYFNFVAVYLLSDSQLHSRIVRSCSPNTRVRCTCVL